MNKKFLSLVLALVMVLGTFSSVFAAPAEKKEAKEAPKATEVVVPKLTGKKAKIDWLKDRGYISGRKVNEDPKNNDLALDKTIQRAEVSKLLVFATGNENKVDALKGITIYKDVTLSNWANGYINVGSTEPSKANNLPFLLGYPGNVFKPVNNVTYAELAKMLVTLTKTDLTKAMHDQANKNWPAQWMAWAADLGIFEDVTVADANKAVNREDAFTMIFNAMYRLKEIKVMPANETMGILSQIKNGEITINQGEKAKTVKVTPNTTFVLYDRRSNDNTLDVNARIAHRAVLADLLSNPSYYYGSLVRVLVNEKGEATHVLELGNPAQGAIGNCDNNDNDRWADVADRTVETVRGEKAEVLYKDGDAKSIVFGDVLAGTNIELKLAKATRYFVADVAKNQLTEVKDVDEALRIVGNTPMNMIERVYAGYNVVSDVAKHETSSPTAIKGYNEATVVVFNKVQKDNNGEVTLRVKNDVTSKYDITFEDVDGKEVMLNVSTYRGGFPNNFNADKKDVVRWTNNNAAGIAVEKLIDHSDTDRYPIVKVIDKDGAKLVVEDKFGSTARLVVDTDADIFLNGQLDKGAVIQFRNLAKNLAEGTVTEKQTVSVVSVLASTTTLDGALQRVVYDNQDNQFVGTFAKEDVDKYEVGGYYKVVVNQARGFYDNTDIFNRDYVWVSKSNVEALNKYFDVYGSPVQLRFKLKANVKGNENEAYDLEVLVNNNWVNIKTQMADYEKHTSEFVAAVDKAPKLDVIKAETDAEKIKEITKTLKELSAQYEALTKEEKANKDVAQRLGWLNNKIVAHNALTGAEQLPAFIVEAK